MFESVFKTRCCYARLSWQLTHARCELSTRFDFQQRQCPYPGYNMFYTFRFSYMAIYVRTHF